MLSREVRYEIHIHSQRYYVTEEMLASLVHDGVLSQEQMGKVWTFVKANQKPEIEKTSMKRAQDPASDATENKKHADDKKDVGCSAFCFTRRLSNYPKPIHLNASYIPLACCLLTNCFLFKPMTTLTRKTPAVHLRMDW